MTITPRLILSHLSGIRHYEKDAKKVREDREKAKRPLKLPGKEEKSLSENNPKTEDSSTNSKENKQAQKKKEFEQEEYYLKDSFESVILALDLFKDNTLVFKPGRSYGRVIAVNQMSPMCIQINLRKSKLVVCHLQAPPSCTQPTPSPSSVPWWRELLASASWIT